MGLYITISVAEQSDDLAFDTTLDAINLELGESDAFGEYFDDVASGWNAATGKREFKNDQPIFLHQEPTGELKFFDREDPRQPYETVETWGMFGLDAIQILANHITQGEIVFLEEIEGNSPKYYKATPGKAEKVKPKF